MAKRTNIGTTTILGDSILERPDPASMPQGTIFRDVSTGQEYALIIDSGNGFRFWQAVTALIPVVPPASPAYYVSNTGNDGPTHTGSITDPLASVQEALRRLGASSWSGAPFVILMNAIKDVLAFPTWSFPEPQGEAQPITIQTTYGDSGLGTVIPTGGTAGGTAPEVLPTITTGLAVVANAYKGMTANFHAGALNNTRFMIDSNTNLGVFNFCGIPLGAPDATTPFTVLQPLGTYQCDGFLRIVGTCAFDGVQFNSIGFVLDGATIQATACQLLGSALQAATFTGCGAWLGNAIPGLLYTATTQLAIKNGVLPCGNRYDGLAGGYTLGGILGGRSGALAFADIGGSFEHFDFSTSVDVLKSFKINAFSSMTSCGILVADSPGGAFMVARTVMSLMRKVSGATAAIQIAGAMCDLNLVDIQNTLAGSDIVQVTHGGTVYMSGVTGANPAAGKALIVASRGLAVFDPVTSPNYTGGTAATDIQIDGDPAFAIAGVVTLGNVAQSGARDGLLQFGGGATVSATAISVFLGNQVPGATNNAGAAQIKTPISPGRRALKLRINVTQNNVDVTTTLTVIDKNGASTGITIPIGANATGLLADVTHTAIFADGDSIDFQLTATAATNGRTIQLNGTIELAS